MRRTRSVAGLSALFLVLGMVIAAPAFAAATCTIDADGVVMTVNMDGTATTIVRDEATDKIKVSTTGGAEVICGTPSNTTDPWPYTVFDIDTVHVTGTGTLTLDMSGGQFAPGFSSESGTDEIEFHLADALSLIINGSPAADRWKFGVGDGTPADPTGVGLNSDSDADIMGGTPAAPANLDLASITANGLAGNDIFEQVSSATTETLNGGDGRDTVTYEDRAAPVIVTIGGGDGDGEALENDNVAADIETVIGGAGGDNISVVATASILKYRLEGGAGDDELSGAAGRDSLFGEDGIDTLNGLGGRDFLNGGDGNDTENGGDGNDIFDQERDSNGADILNGENGTDSVKYNLRTTGVLVTVGDAADDGGCTTTACSASTEGDNVADDIEVVTGGREDDVLVAAATGSGTDNIGTKLVGGGGNDKLFGGAGKDKLLGGAGNDLLVGGAAVDRLSGGSDNDTMLGGGGDDRLSGSSGDDKMNGEAGSDRLAGSSGVDELWGDGVEDKVKDTLVGGSQPSGKKDKCEVDPKDLRSGCEAKLASSDAPESSDYPTP